MNTLPRGDVEECAEDGMVAYLRSKLPGWVTVLPAFDTAAEPGDAVIVFCQSEGAVSEDAEQHAQTRATLNVTVAVDAAPAKLGGAVIKGARERAREMRSAVYCALAVLPTEEDSLKLRLIATQTAGVAWSMAQLGVGKRGLNTDDNKRKLVTTYPVDVIIEPEE